MPRTARTILRGYCYHLINRGNNQACIFHDASGYQNFVSLIAEAQERLELPLLAACLMPNHVHLVVKPREERDLAIWMHWTFTTHVRRYHARYKTSGRIWQDRFKAFVIEEDNHLLTVLRYVERNALRAGLTERAERWPWGSASWRLRQSPALALTAPPVPLPSNWIEYVNSPQTPAELEAVRLCVNRQRPFGNVGWVERKARQLGLSQSLAPFGRPATTTD